MASCRAKPAETAARKSESSCQFPCMTTQLNSHDPIRARTAFPLYVNAGVHQFTAFSNER